MKPGPPRRFRATPWFTYGFALLVPAACTPTETRFSVLSFKDQANQQLYSEQFPEGAFAVTAHRNTLFLFEIEPPRENDPGTVPAAAAPASDRPSQIIRIEVFWKPRPGTTYAESSQTNAHISYCLISGRNAIRYEGAGFVFFRLSRDGKSVAGEVESSVLVPAHVAGDPLDLFGPCHFRGTFTALENRRKVAEIEQRLRRCTAVSQPTS